ncbi:hypothetical protein CEUSTIGMA_g4523.t1, partial [Chlamydomonas eustigma]
DREVEKEEEKEEEKVGEMEEERVEATEVVMEVEKVGEDQEEMVLEGGVGVVGVVEGKAEWAEEMGEKEEQVAEREGGKYMVNMVAMTIHGSHDNTWRP